MVCVCWGHYDILNIVEQASSLNTEFILMLMIIILIIVIIIWSSISISISISISSISSISS